MRPGVRLVVADEAQKRERDRLTHEAWGGKLTVEQFVEREARLRAHRWAGRNMTSWLMVDGDHYQILSSCESFEMTSFLDGRAGRTFGVASVYTEPALRGRGHAAQMMKLLVDAVGPHQAGVLFSDVGDYYARLGWRVVPSFEYVVAPSLNDSAAERLSGEEPERLSGDEIDQLWTSIDIPRSRFIVWPSAEQLDWHRERERAYAELFGRAPLAHAGARTAGGVIAWAADFKNDKLVILHLHAFRREEPRALIRAAQQQAAKAQLSSVVAWDVLSHWPEDLGQRRPRSDSLPMVLPLADGSAAWHYVPRALWI